MHSQTQKSSQRSSHHSKSKSSATNHKPTLTQSTFPVTSSQVRAEIRDDNIRKAKEMLEDRYVNKVNPGTSVFTQVTVVGDNSEGQLGIGGDPNNAQVLVPKLMCFNIHVRQVACGEKHTHMLAKSGHLYSMGSNEHG